MISEKPNKTIVSKQSITREILNNPHLAMENKNPIFDEVFDEPKSFEIPGKMKNKSAPDESKTELIAFTLTLLFHSLIFFIPLFHFAERRPIVPETNYRIPVHIQMTQTAEPIQAELPAAVPNKAAKKPQKKAKQTANPTSLPGDRTTPAVISQSGPIYPKVAQNNEWAGTVIVEVTVDKKGIPKGIKVIQSSGHDMLDLTFIKTIQDSYQFNPKRTLGQDIEGKIQLSYTFSIE